VAVHAVASFAAELFVTGTGDAEALDDDMLSSQEETSWTRAERTRQGECTLALVMSEIVVNRLALKNEKGGAQRNAHEVE